MYREAIGVAESESDFAIIYRRNCEALLLAERYREAQLRLFPRSDKLVYRKGNAGRFYSQLEAKLTSKAKTVRQRIKLNQGTTALGSTRRNASAAGS